MSGPMLQVLIVLGVLGAVTIIGLTFVVLGWWE